MGYVPPRPQLAGESDLEYLAYLERRLRHASLLAWTLLIGLLAVAVTVVIAIAIETGATA